MTVNDLLKDFLKEMAAMALKFARVVGSRAGFLIRGLTTACLSILRKVGEYRALFRPVRTDGKTEEGPRHSWTRKDSGGRQSPPGRA